MPLQTASLLAARIALAAVFVAAGMAKLADRAGSRQAMLDFGAPAWLATPSGTLLPAAELLIAAALLPVATARWAALAALGLLAVFTAAIAMALARGNAPSCRCFGQLAAAPVGPHTLARNGALLAVAAFLTVRGWHDPGPSLLSPIVSLTPAGRLAAAAAAGVFLLGGAVVLLMVEVMRQQGRILLRLEGSSVRWARPRTCTRTLASLCRPLPPSRRSGCPWPRRPRRSNSRTSMARVWASTICSRWGGRFSSSSFTRGAVRVRR
jgi:uncharacterized membrane protein YphA (DoxX/SURF4 family)